MKSTMFRRSKRGTFGRRATRNLDDLAVVRATIAARDPERQAKFLSRRGSR